MFRGTRWGISKLICSGIPAIKNSLVKNKQCQIIKIPFDKYTIEYVSCFLGKFNKDIVSYNLILGVYDTDDNGLPQTLLGFSSISSDAVSSPAWYGFNFGGSLNDRTTPANQLLALVFYQDGGNERNYVNWYYSLDLSCETKAYVSKDDGATWVQQDNMTRAIIISDIFNIFEEAYVDSAGHRLVFPAGQVGKLYVRGNNYLAGGEFFHTQLSENAVSIDYRPSVLSVVIDSSGSMGWNDRYRDRIVAIRELISRLKSQYPGKVYFDMVSFGSCKTTPTSLAVFDSLQTYAGVKLDLSTPTNFSNNNDGSVPSISDGFVAWGLKDLENSHEYIISSVNFCPSNMSVEDGLGVLIPETNIYSPVNYQNVGNQNNFIKYSVEQVGPGSEKETVGGANMAKNAITCKIPSSNTNIIRKPFASLGELNTAFVIRDVAKGDVVVFVDSFVAFNINGVVDLFDAEHIDAGLKIVSKETIGGENKITLDRAIGFDFKNSFESNGSLLQESSINSAFSVDTNDTMLNLIIKDTQANKTVTFYLQSSKGGVLEWEFTPFREWKAYMLFYAGDTAKFDFKLFDSAGNPLPDFTAIHLLVDKDIAKTEATKEFSTLRNPVKTGDDFFTVWSNDSETATIYPVARGDFIILSTTIGEEVLAQGYTVIDVEETEEIDPANPLTAIRKKRVTFAPPHAELWDATEIMLDAKQETETLLKVDIPISGVDISPTIAGRKLPPELLEVQDPPQVEPSSGLNDFNQSKERKRDNVIDIPLIGGQGRVRILPITEDIIETAEKKKQDAFGFYDDTSLTEKESIKKQALEQDYAKKTSTGKEVSSQTNIAETTDYTIETPIYLIKGEASSHMTARAREMTPLKMSNENPPCDYKVEFIDDNETKLVPDRDKTYSNGEVMAKRHTIYPSITVDVGERVLNQKMQNFNVYFQSPIQMASCVVGTQQTYCSFSRIDPAGGGIYKYVDIPAIYSLSSDFIKLHYNVYYKGAFLKEGQMRIKIFDANRKSTAMLEPAEVNVNLETEASPYEGEILPPTTPLAEEINYYHEDPEERYINGIELQEATYLPGYPEGGYLVDVEDGRAVLTITSSIDINFAAHLKIFAEVVSPNDAKRSTILRNTVFIRMPLEITPMVNGTTNFPSIPDNYQYLWPSSKCPGHENRIFLEGDGKTTYNFGAQITWMGEAVGDNTLVEFASTKENVDEITKINPSVSKSIGGTAQDAYAGPHAPVMSWEVEVESGEEKTLVKMGPTEDFTIRTSFRGVKCSASFSAMWMGALPEKEGTKPILYLSSLIYRNGSFVGGGVGNDTSTHLWADGWEYALLLVDLSVSYVGGFDGVKETAPFLLGDFKTGNEQNKPVVVSFSGFGRGMFTKNKPVDPVTNQPLNLLVLNTTNIPYGWAVSPPIRRSFRPSPPASPDEKKCQDCYPYDCSIMAITAALPKNTKTYSSMRGCWSTVNIDCRCLNPDTGRPTGDWYKPVVYWDEPLQGSMSVMSEESPYVHNKIVMDGRNRTRVDAELSFSGKAIPIVAKKHKVVKFATAQDTQLFTQVAGRMSTEQLDPSTTAYNDQMYDYYMGQIDNQDSQTTGNISLIQYQSKPTLTWMDYFPNVYFEVFLGFPSYDNRGRIVGATKSRSVSALSLTQDGVLLSIKYTALGTYVSSEEIEIDGYAGIENHFHECTINEYGNGKTIKTFKENTYEEIENHDHSILDFVVQNAIDNNNVVHLHELKSTATVYINPFTLESLGYLRSRTIKGVATDEIEEPEDIRQLEQIVVVGRTEYDASRDFVERAVSFCYVGDIYDESTVPYEKRWGMTLSTTKEPTTRSTSTRTDVSPVGIVYTQESTTEDYPGFNIDLNVVRNDGTKPPDGTRAQIEIGTYAVMQTGQSNTDVKNNGINRYLNLKITAKTIIENQQLMSEENDGTVAVLTKFSLLPKITCLLPEITDDETYIDTALAKIESIGCSQLNDAIIEATSRIKKHYLENSEQNTSYNIIVFSDGDENYSEHNFAHTIKVLSVGFDTPICAVGLGNVGIVGKALLNAYAFKTGGNSLSYGANSAEQMEERIVDIIKNQQTNIGTYSNVIEFPGSFCLKEVSPLVVVPQDSKMYISFQIGNYLNNLSTWSGEFLVAEGQPINIEDLVQNTKNKYIKYRLVMTGNEHFQSPEFLGCLSTYVQPRICKIFSQPIETNATINEVMSEITVAHKATNSDLVEIEYGVCLLNSVRETNYYNNCVLPFKSGERYVILSRSNESMSSEDGITYAAQNGVWDESLQISVFSASPPASLYKPVNSDEYVAYPTEGKISFVVPRQVNDSIIFSVSYPSQFRILCRVKNHSLEVAHIDHIGLTYGLATKSTGTPVSSYIGLFESSSSESEPSSSSSSG